MLRSGNAVSPIAKAKKTTGLPLSCSKKHPLPVNSYRSLRAFIPLSGCIYGAEMIIQELRIYVLRD
jgi:hypothetical protein